MESRREKLEEWRKKKEAEQIIECAKKEAPKLDLKDKRTAIKANALLPRNRKVENIENTHPKQKVVRKNISEAKKDDDSESTFARRMRLEEWKKQKENEKSSKGSINAVAALGESRRQTISSNLQNKRQTFSQLKTQRTNQGRRQTFCVRPSNKQNENKQQKQAVLNPRRQTFDKKTTAFTQKDKSSGVTKTTTHNPRRETFGINGTVRKPSVERSRTVQSSIASRKAGQSRAAEKTVLTSRPSSGASVRSRSASSLSSDIDKKQKPKRDDVEKKGKFIFVKSRIDTGLSNIKRTGPCAKPPSGKPPAAKSKPATSTASRPIWNATKPKPPMPASSHTTQKQVKTPRVTSPSKRRSCLVPSKPHTSPEKRRKTISSTPAADGAALNTSRIPLAMTPVRSHVRFLSPHTRASPGCSSTVGGSLSVRKRAQSTPRMGTPCTRDMAMRAKLNSWLSARGKTPSRYRHLMCFHGDHDDVTSNDDTVDGGLTEAELSLQQEQLERESLVGSFIQSPLPGVAGGEVQAAVDPTAKKLKCLLNECTLLLESGCPQQNVSEWLSEIERSIPSALQAAQYWVIKAELVEQGGGDNSDVIDVYEQAVRHHASPPEEVAEALSKFVQRMNTRKPPKLPSSSQNTQPETKGNTQDIHNTPYTATTVTQANGGEHVERDENGVYLQRDQGGIEERLLQNLRISESDRGNDDDVFESTSIRYCMTQATPFFKKLRAKADGLPTPHAKITPVRRSTRKSVGSLPPMLRDHDLVLESLDDISPGSKNNIIYQSNKALLDEFDSVASDEN